MAKRRKTTGKNKEIIRNTQRIVEPQKMNTLVDVIIPVFQRFDLLGQCLEALPKAFGEIGYRVIIFDNGSPFDLANDFYARLPSDIKVIRNKENIGFPKACNLAFDRSYSPLVFFLNDDVILHEGSMEIMIHAMDDPKVGVAGMKLIFPEVTDLPQTQVHRPAGKVQHVGLATNIRAEVFHIFLGWSPDHPKVNAMKDVIGVTGAAMLTRRVVYNKAGKFFEGYGIGTYEDIDYCLSVKKLGYNVIVVPEAVGIHHTGATAVTYNIPYPLNENRMIFLQRWQQSLDWTEWLSY